jgi:hypothetical protein
VLISRKTSFAGSRKRWRTASFGVSIGQVKTTGATWIRLSECPLRQVTKRGCGVPVQFVWPALLRPIARSLPMISRLHSESAAGFLLFRTEPCRSGALSHLESVGTLIAAFWGTAGGTLSRLYALTDERTSSSIGGFQGRLSINRRGAWLRLMLPKLDVADSSPVARSQLMSLSDSSTLGRFASGVDTRHLHARSETKTVRGWPGDTTSPATTSGYARSKRFRTPTSASSARNVQARVACASP